MQSETMNVRDYLHTVSEQRILKHSGEEEENERKRNMNKDENSEQNKIKDLTMHMYKVLSSRSKGLDEVKKQTTTRVTTICETIMTNSMEHEHNFQKYFSDELTGAEAEIKLEMVDVNRYDMRVHFKDFPLPQAIDVGFGAQAGVPHGYAHVQINPTFGRIEKMIVKSSCSNLLAGDLVAPLKIVPWFTDGIVRSVRALQRDENNPDHNKISVSYCETGVQLEIQETDKSKDKARRMSTLTEEGSKPKQQLILVTFIACLKATGLPKNMRLQHPLPNREPYASQGKKLIDHLLDKVNEGKSLYTLDACLELDENNKPVGGYWNTNFRNLTDKILDSARSFGKTNMIDPAIHVLEMISLSRNWDIPLAVIETAALWEYKRNANTIRSEAVCFSAVLRRLHGYFEGQSCPHFFLANYNMLKMEDNEWCKVISKELGDAISLLDDEPSTLIELTGTRRREKKDREGGEREVGDPETASLQSHSIANESIA